MNFIRLACHDSEWELAAVGTDGTDATGGAGGARRVFAQLARLEYGQGEELRAAVSLAAQRVNAHALHHMMVTYRLRQHCLNLKQYVLLSKGDFVQYLMEHLSAQLSKPAVHLHRHQLLSHVELAIRSSGADAETSLLLEHIDVQLLQAPGATGWDAFALDYHASAPLDSLLTPEVHLHLSVSRHVGIHCSRPRYFTPTSIVQAMAQYRQLFIFLWRLKRVEHSLTAVWRKHGTSARLLPALRGDRLLHGCHTLRNSMIHFV